MAKIILLSQRVTKDELLDSIKGKKIGKIFFQCVLRSIKDYTAVFGLVAYAAKKEKSGIKKWNVGSPVYCKDGPSGDNREFDLPDPHDEPIAFGNMEVQLSIEFSFTDLYDDVNKKIEKEADEMKKLIMMLNQLPKGKGLLLSGSISKNPHVDYTVTIEGTTSGAQANPCPPNQPGDN